MDVSGAVMRALCSRILLQSADGAFQGRPDVNGHDTILYNGTSTDLLHTLETMDEISHASHSTCLMSLMKARTV